MNSSTLFERWPGTLIKLGIRCGTEEKNCVILKIESVTENVSNVVYTSPWLPLPNYFIQHGEHSRTLAAHVCHRIRSTIMHKVHNGLTSHSVFAAPERNTNFSFFSSNVHPN